ncbi:winged helix-turn-helix domain-containing protein [Streptomyces pseudovenezuelae]|uniref:Winged helix-turn-helix domain-containing protein n=1 Tax=Streptomyces pseudovenezuelae TaxID=67350 RepID=A0ABZ1X429_9ACTN|nr:winged helix-turn-helix domain-containing protein [Streptomyces pseudovenezuelae]
MTGISGPRTGRVRALIVDDEPALDEVLSVAVAVAVAVTGAGRRPCPALDGRSAPRTARDALEHRLDGPEAGAEDSVQVLGDLVMGEDTREVRRTGVPVRLAAKEYNRLGLLLAHPRPVLSTAQNLDHVRCGSLDGGATFAEVHISHPRRKFDRGPAPVIPAVRGLGYAIRAAEDGR